VAEEVPRKEHIFLVDLSPSLLSIARERIRCHGWDRVSCVQEDVCTFDPGVPLDLVTFSYSLTMIPDWHRAIAHAVRLLRPGGVLGVVDFYVSRKFPPKHGRRHGWLRRLFWRSWFELDNVFLSPDHLPVLMEAVEPVAVSEDAGPVPYVPLLRAPYYAFVGRKRSSCEAPPGDSASGFDARNSSASPNKGLRPR